MTGDARRRLREIRARLRRFARSTCGHFGLRAEARRPTVVVPRDAESRVATGIEPGLVSIIVTIPASAIGRAAATIESARAVTQTAREIVTVHYVNRNEHTPREVDPVDGTVAIAGWHASYGSAVNAALQQASGEFLVFLDSAFVPRVGALDRLVQAARVGRMVQPLAVTPAGIVLSAGVGSFHRRLLPVHLLEGHLEDDPGIPPDIAPIGAIGIPVFAAPAAHLTGVDPQADDVAAVASLSVQGANEGLHVCVDPSARVVHAGGPIPSPHHPESPEATGWPRLVRSTHAFFDHSGFRVERIMPGVHTGEIRDATLVLRRTAPEGIAEDVPQRRWALKTAAHPGVAGSTWGDTFFANDLADALRALGQEVVIDNRETIVRPKSDYLDDVVVTIRGLERVPVNPAAINILWVISHPDEVSDDELADYDVVFAASEHWARSAEARSGVMIRPLLQATAPRRFHLSEPTPSMASDVLFVGTTRNLFRPVVRDALAAGASLSVYGGGWREFLPASAIRGEFLSNEDAPAAYRSARIVLNDHWDDMANHGFHSNRLFDAVSAGALVVSDRVPGIEEIFGSSVRTYATVDELRDLLDPAMRGWPDAAERRSNAERIARLHSFDARARTLLDAIERFRR